MFVQDPSEYVEIIDRFLGSKNRNRQQFLEETVDPTFNEVFSSVEQFLDVFLKMKREVGRLLDQLSGKTNDLDEILDQFVSLVEQVEEQINPGQVARMRTYAKALDGLESDLFIKKVVKVLDPEEEALAKHFFGSVSAFFENGPAYSHDMRSTLLFAQRTASRLRNQDRDVKKIHQEMSDLSNFVLNHESRMLRKWGNIARYHAALARRLKIR